ncbi:hypothetical protein A3740_11350 [Oleiphilus sp. HI0068]|jgi:hypothetical protein|nr:hypothetical protein A3740_11350 [Oleiphilus sp. HI0068]KZY80518.1 hypothetical protein A3741_18710 [Oleiphilus sp. HI0069]KZZ46517.1 hypothetical protein A3755_18605 [Oleiphilus sp. HI0085]
MKLTQYLMLLTCLILTQVVAAEGTVIAIEGATIRGNQELPTVLYLVPWQPAKVYSLDEPEQTLASSRPIQPLDRASFLRMQSYHEAFSKQNVKATTVPAIPK